MPRRREVPKREILPDPKFGNVELSKFMNVIMEGGKKAVAERIIYGALETMEEERQGSAGAVHRRHQQRQADGRGQEPPRGRRQLPGAGRGAPVRRLALSMRWIKEAARKRGEKSMACAWPTSCWKPPKAVAAR
jgi:small subunit ribosomal protein S7